jgi:o-succinylbenzoate synthase
MRLASLQLYRYALRLTTPLVLKSGVINSRQGLLLKFTDDKGNVGFGEVAPLPGLSRESLEEVMGELQQISKSILKQKINQTLLDFNGKFQSWSRSNPLSPSTHFGIEMGLTNLLAAAHRLQLSELFSSRISGKVQVNALLNYDTTDIKAAVKKLLNEGYQTIKLKVGQGKLQQDVRRVQELREAGGEKISLRLDANQAWSLSEAVRFGKQVRDFKIEYIEEPLQDPSALGSFYQECGVPVALDESLSTLEFHHLDWDFSIKAIVLKPMILGSLAKIIPLIQRADSAGIYPVFSSAFESGLTLSFLVQLAAVFSPPAVAMGLDTYKWLGEDLLENPFRVKQGWVGVKKVVEKANYIDFSKLKLIF